jgi:cyclopropane fatty-acyl-phospholipid synthase-like methyltransferase
MTNQMELYWKLYAEWFSNERILNDFYNPIKAYSNEVSGKIIDIGCGQSAYLLDFLNSDFELFAVDKDKIQLDFLRQRVKKSGYNPNRINYSFKEFPSDDFNGKLFNAIIVSNLLHFFVKSEANTFILELKKYCKSGTLISITVHSSAHLSNKKEITSNSYFKSFYSKNELCDMFPDTEFEYLYINEKEKIPDNYSAKFLEYWINEFLKDKKNMKEIHEIQKDYLKGNRINSIEILVRKK